MSNLLSETRSQFVARQKVRINGKEPKQRTRKVQEARCHVALHHTPNKISSTARERQRHVKAAVISDVLLKKKKYYFTFNSAQTK